MTSAFAVRAASISRSCSAAAPPRDLADHVDIVVARDAVLDDVDHHPRHPGEQDPYRLQGPLPSDPPPEPIRGDAENEVSRGPAPAPTDRAVQKRARRRPRPERSMQLDRMAAPMGETVQAGARDGLVEAGFPRRREDRGLDLSVRPAIDMSELAADGGRLCARRRPQTLSGEAVRPLVTFQFRPARRRAAASPRR